LEWLDLTGLGRLIGAPMAPITVGLFGLPALRTFASSTATQNVSIGWSPRMKEVQHSLYSAMRGRQIQTTISSTKRFFMSVEVPTCISVAFERATLDKSMR
jgi:hypothetical protein